MFPSIPCEIENMFWASALNSEGTVIFIEKMGSRNSFFFNLNLLRCNWHITLYEFEVYNAMISYSYILQNDRHSKSS